MFTQGDTVRNGERASKVRFGELLLSKGLLQSRDLTEALNEQQNCGGRLGEILVKLKMLSDEEVRCALAEHLATERIHLDINEIDMNVARLVPETIAKRFNLVAIGRRNNKLLVAMNDPLDIIATDTITLKTRHEVQPVLSSPSEIQHAIEFVYHGSDVDEQSLRDLVELQVDSENGELRNHDSVIENALEADISVEEAATKAPVIRFVDLLLRQAVKSRASEQEFSLAILAK